MRRNAYPNALAAYKNPELLEATVRDIYQEAPDRFHSFSYNFDDWVRPREEHRIRFPEMRTIDRKARESRGERPAKDLETLTQTPSDSDSSRSQ